MIGTLNGRLSGHVCIVTQWMVMDAGRVTSVCGNRYGQVFATKDFFCEIYPMATRILLARLLRNLCQITVSRKFEF